MNDSDDTHTTHLSRDAAATAIATALQKARQEHGSLPCLDEIEGLVAEIEAHRQICYDALRSVRAIAGDAIIGVLAQDGRDAPSSAWGERVEVNQASVIHIAR